MPIKIKFDDGDSFKEIQVSINQHETDIREQVSEAGDETAQKMKEIIDSSKVRPQAGEPTELEDAIDVEHFSDGGWGVGNIQKLDEKAKYWRAVNFGSAHMVGKLVPRGQFEPGEPEPNPENSRQGRWKAGQGNHMFLVKNPIPPMNFIEKTINFVKEKFNSIKSKNI